MKLDTVHFMQQIRIQSVLKTSILNELTELKEKQRQVLTSSNDFEDDCISDSSQCTKFSLLDLDLELMVQADREK